MSGLVWL